MDGLPVTIRLIDPPLHEFLPSHDELLTEVTRLRSKQAGTGSAGAGRALDDKRCCRPCRPCARQNPMLGLRGVRLGIHMPSLTRMQVRAIFEAACAAPSERRRSYSPRS
jgi:pyruvate,orthophosphate dikinase